MRDISLFLKHNLPVGTGVLREDLRIFWYCRTKLRQIHATSHHNTNSAETKGSFYITWYKFHYPAVRVFKSPGTIKGGPIEEVGRCSAQFLYKQLFQYSNFSADLNFRVGGVEIYNRTSRSPWTTVWQTLNIALTKLLNSYCCRRNKNVHYFNRYSAVDYLSND